MDTILRLLEGLRRDELVWLNTYLTGRLRAMPPLLLQLRRSRGRLCLQVPVQPVIRVESYRWRRLQSELVILICLWIRGNGQELHLKGGRHTSRQ